MPEQAAVRPRTSAKEAVQNPIPDLGAGVGAKGVSTHPAGRTKHGFAVSALRMGSFVSWLFWVCASIFTTQILGIPLYLINKDYFYAYMALTKQSFGLYITAITQWYTSTVIRVSGDESVRGQLHRTKDGVLSMDFPERLILIANHQIYTDWLYLWWAAYTNKMHGHLFIILKESLKYIPILGQGMMFYGFIFMARNWEKDKPRMEHRLRQLRSRHGGPLSGTQPLDPMWLMIFPEGTNLSANTRKRSAAWAAKNNIKDFEHVLLPRALGLHFCLTELRGTVDWVYDCTIAYEGIPRGAYGQDVYPLHSSFFQGRSPKSVHMYWRRISVNSIPLDDLKAFEAWLHKQWQIKEDLLEGFAQSGMFPADQGQETTKPLQGQQSNGDRTLKGAGYIETRVQLVHWYEIGQIFVVLAAFALAFNIIARVYNLAIYGSFKGLG